MTVKVDHVRVRAAMQREFRLHIWPDIERRLIAERQAIVNRGGRLCTDTIATSAVCYQEAIAREPEGWRCKHHVSAQKQ